MTTNDMRLLKLPVSDKIEHHFVLTYFMRNLQVNGDEVCLKFNGKFHMPRSN